MSAHETRWIFSYRYNGTRDLSEVERAHYRLRGIKMRTRAVALGLLGVLVLLAAFAFLVIAADKKPLFWIPVVLSVSAFFKVLAMANDQEGVGLLCRRVARKGRVDSFVPAERPRVRASSRSHEDEDDPTSPPYPYWKHDEKFEELLVKVCGRHPTHFETPAGDDVLLTVQDREVRHTHNFQSDYISVDEERA